MFGLESMTPAMSTLMAIGVLIAVVCLMIWAYASRYEKVGPNEVLIVSGRKSCMTDPETGEKVVKNFSIYHGGGTLVLPIRERVDRMSVELMTLEICTPEFFTEYGIPIVVDGIAQIKVLSDDSISVATAAEMFLSKTKEEMNEIAHQMMQGHLRAVISTLPFEEIHRNPEAFAQTVQRLTAADLLNMGIQVVSFTIRSVQDPSDYLKALGRPQLAEVRKNAALGEAQADSESIRGKAEADRLAAITSAKAEQESETARIDAELKINQSRAEKTKLSNHLEAEVSKSKASADLAYELEQTRVQQELVQERLGVSRLEREKQIELEELEIQRKEMELVHSVHKPSDAERYRIEMLASAESRQKVCLAEAEAEASRTRGRAEADVIRARGEAEADAIRCRALAEAEGRKATLLAEAEGMSAKAGAWREYGSAALGQLVIEALPEIAAAVAAPLQKIDRITLVSGNGADSGSGVQRITQGVSDVVGQLPGLVSMVSGLDLADLLQQLPVAGEASEAESEAEEEAASEEEVAQAV